MCSSDMQQDEDCWLLTLFFNNYPGTYVRVSERVAVEAFHSKGTNLETAEFESFPTS